MRNIFAQLYDILSSRDRRIVLLLFVLMFMSAVMETIGIASILPFIAVLSNPEVVEQNAHLRRLFEMLGFTDRQDFLFFLGFMFLFLFLFGLLMRTLAYWAQARFANSRVFLISSRVFFGYLCKPYEWFLDKHSSRLATTVLSEVDRTINQALFPALQLIAHSMVIALLLALLFYIDPVLATSVVVVLGGSYLVIYLLVHRGISRLAQTIFVTNRGRYKTVNEACSGIKDLKIGGLELSFLSRFQQDVARFARSRTAEQLIGQLPSYAMQGVIFGGMLTAILYLMTVYDDFSEALPVLAMYAIAGYRMMPSLQNGYRHVVTVRNAAPVVAALHADLASIGETDSVKESLAEVPALRLQKEIRIRDVHYRYPDAEADALRGVSLVIPKGATVAFVGSTGCGKTTLVDVILGLLQPASGAVEVDGKVLSPGDVRAWRKNIGYVPQDVYLADTTITENIAYGRTPDEVDHAAVESAARLAEIHAFVTEELPERYETEVGERGVRLSGGQKQRIGIARALYSDPEVLVLDEATSALDSITEKTVMDSVQHLASSKTIIMIAHRISTVRACDTIFLLENGRVEASGSYDELVRISDYFRRAAGEIDGGDAELRQ